MNKLLIILALLTILGCRSRKTFIEKELAGATVEKIVQAEVHATEKQKKDSVIQKTKTETKTDQSTNLHVEFDPKTSDSLEVLHTNGKDSVKLKINGKGLVIFDFKKDKSETKSESKELFGSETLHNIDSTFKSKEKEKAEIKITKSTKQTESNGFQLPVYMIAGIAIVVLLVLWFGWKKFGGSFLDGLKRKR